MTFGVIFGWSRSAFEKIKNANIKFTEVDFSIIAAILNVGCLLSCLIVGYVVGAIGRKATLLLMAIPYIFGWAFVIWGKTFTALFIGRFMMGFGGALFLTCPQTSIYK
jgi:MFS family permease